MNRPRRVRSPPFGYEPRGVMGHRGGAGDQRSPSDYGDPYGPGKPFEQTPPIPFNELPMSQQQPPQPIVPPPHPMNYPRDHRLPSAYRANSSFRGEPIYNAPSATMGNSAPYKILCITNINHKVSDGPVKGALTSDFSRFGDISVSICHDSGERLAYIYFRTYEEAREARHAKARTLLFDRPIEIEPIYEPRSTSPIESPPPTPSQAHLYTAGRRRSMSPPNYYGVNGPMPIPSRRPPQPPPHQPLPMPHHRGMSPLNYPHSSRNHQHSHPQGPPMAPGPVPYGRHYMQPSHLPPPPQSPYSSPPHEPPYRSNAFSSVGPYQHNLPLSPQHLPPSHMPPVGHSYHQHYAHPQFIRERDRAFNEFHMGPERSPRHDPYYPMEHHRSINYPPQPPPPHPIPAPNSSRGSSSIHSSHYQHLHPGPGMHHNTMSRDTPPHHIAPEHPPRYMSREFRREKFGHEGHGCDPEEGRPSRVLFINNIDASKTEFDLRDVFDTFGNIEELEIKKLTPEIAAALIKFSSMDCAYKAKTATNGKYLGNSKCRITYGKVSASRRLWIGGFGPNTTMACLEDEFGKFGTITNLDYISGRPYAYVEYETANQAQFATHQLRGTFVAKAERRIRIEYVDPVDRTEKASRLESSSIQDNSSRSRTTNESWTSSTANEHDTTATSPHQLNDNSNSRKRSISPSNELSSKRQNNNTTYENEHLARETEANQADDSRSESNIIGDDQQTRGQIGQPKSPHENKSNHESDKNELNNNQDNTTVRHENNRGAKSINDNKTSDNNKIEFNELDKLDKFAQSKSIREMVDCCSVSWLSQLVLRNFNFPSRMFMVSGRKQTIDRYLRSENGDPCPLLRITQRWRLNPQPKLEEVRRRMQTESLGMFIITSRVDHLSPNQTASPSCKTPQSSGSNHQVQQSGGTNRHNGDNSNETAAGAGSDHDDKTGGSSGSPSATQSRPLKNLISYLEQKDAAGVISLNLSDRNTESQADGCKLLYTFPPGEFALNLLRRKAPSLVLDSEVKEEFLLGVIIGTTDAKI